MLPIKSENVTARYYTFGGVDGPNARNMKNRKYALFLLSLQSIADLISNKCRNSLTFI